jgi:sugar/nucleoside kinase (ribokinase family)
VLYGAYRNLPLVEALEMGNAAAACSLTESGATEGMRRADDALMLCRELRK